MFVTKNTGLIMAKNKRKIDNPPLLIRPEFRRMFKGLPDNEVGQLFNSLMEYRWDGVIPELNEKLSGIFIALRAFADEDAEGYKQVCEANRQKALERWENERSGK